MLVRPTKVSATSAVTAVKHGGASSTIGRTFTRPRAAAVRPPTSEKLSESDAVWPSAIVKLDVLIAAPLPLTKPRVTRQGGGIAPTLPATLVTLRCRTSAEVIP